MQLIAKVLPRIEHHIDAGYSTNINYYRNPRSLMGGQDREMHFQDADAEMWPI